MGKTIPDVVIVPLSGSLRKLFSDPGSTGRSVVSGKKHFLKTVLSPEAAETVYSFLDSVPSLAGYNINAGEAQLISLARVLGTVPGLAITFY